MARPMLKWVFPCTVVLLLGLCSLQAQTQKKIVTVDSISPAPGLHVHAPIALPTYTRSREARSKAMGSRIGRPATSNRASSNREERNDSSERDALRFPADLQNEGGPVVPYA